MQIGDIVAFRDPNSGEERVGLFTREFPAHRSIGVYLPGHREVVVHRDNLQADLS